jgi:hypothetical protein
MEHVERLISRRAVVRSALLGGTGLLVAALVGCDDDDANEPTAPGATSTPATTSGAPEAANDVSPFIGSYTLSDRAFGTEVVVTIEGGTRAIESNALPNHETGDFPNPGNPNTIAAQQYRYVLPASPSRAGEAAPYNVPQPFGIATNGVLIDPFAAEWFNNDASSGWQLAALANPLGFDENNAHVQPTGAYHYHGAPTALITSSDRPELIGFAGDGFPIYGPYGYADRDDAASPVRELLSSYRLKSGERPGGPSGVHDGTYVEDYEYAPGSGDLDECNGRDGVTREFPEGTYYYVTTLGWPFVGRCFAGAIAESFDVQLPEGGAPRDIGGRAGASPDLEASAERLGVGVEALRAALGAPPPDLAAAAATLGVSEEELAGALGVEGP